MVATVGACSKKKQRQQAKRKRNGQGGEDTDWMNPAFKLGGQDQVHEGDAQSERNHEVIGCFIQHVGFPAEDNLILRRQVHLCNTLVGKLHGFV